MATGFSTIFFSRRWRIPFIFEEWFQEARPGCSSSRATALGKCPRTDGSLFFHSFYDLLKKCQTLRQLLGNPQGMPIDPKDNNNDHPDQNNAVSRHRSPPVYNFPSLFLRTSGPQSISGIKRTLHPSPSKRVLNAF